MTNIIKTIDDITSLAQYSMKTHFCCTKQQQQPKKPSRRIFEAYLKSSKEEMLLICCETMTRKSDKGKGKRMNQDCRDYNNR